MGTAEAIILVAKILAPLAEQLMRYIMRETDKVPSFLAELPSHLQSEIELARKLGEVSKG